MPFRSFDGGDVGLCCDNRSYSSQSIRLKYLDNSAANMEYAQSNRKDVAKTIMFSELMYYYSPADQMLIPPKDLVAFLMP